MNREDYIRELKNGICSIVFEKVNGEQRQMNCTLSANHLPVSVDKGYEDAETVSRRISEETIPVWDVVLQEWRSFRVSSILEFERLTGPGVKSEDHRFDKSMIAEMFDSEDSQLTFWDDEYWEQVDETV